MEVPSDVLRKRKLVIRDTTNSETTLKKAKHWWQVKGRSPKDANGIACTSSTEDQLQISLNSEQNVHVECVDTVEHSSNVESASGNNCTVEQSHAEYATQTSRTNSTSSEDLPIDTVLSPVPAFNGPDSSIVSGETNNERESSETRTEMQLINTYSWLKRNTAHAIVDNVFNQTLEEMGLSPNEGINVADRLAVESQSIATIINKHGLSPAKNISITSDIEDNNLSSNLQIIQAIKRPLSDTVAFTAGMHVNQVGTKVRTVSEGIPSCSSVHPTTSSSQDLPMSISSVCEADSTVDTSFGIGEKPICLEGHTQAGTYNEISTTFTQQPVAPETHSSTSNQVSDDVVADMHINENVCSRSSNQHTNQTGVLSGDYVSHDLCNSTTPSLEAGPAGSPQEGDDLFTERMDHRDQAVDSTTTSTNFLEMAVSAAISSQGLTLRDGSQ